MPRIPGINHQQALRVLAKVGFVVIRQGNKHCIVSNGEKRITVPRANPINAFTMGAIARDASLTPDQFRALL